MGVFLSVTVINIFALFMVSNIISGITISGWQTLIASAIVLTFINLFIKPVIKLIMLPVNILTLGFFTLIINAALLGMVSGLVKGFYIGSFSSAFFGAILLSIIYLIIEKFIIANHFMTTNNNHKKQNDTSTNKSINKENVIDVEGKFEDDNER